MVKITEVTTSDKQQDETVKDAGGDENQPSKKPPKRPKIKKTPTDQPKKKGKLAQRYSMKKQKPERFDDGDSDGPEEGESECVSDDENGGRSSSKSSRKENASVYLPSMPLGEDEELVCDPSAYKLHHQIQTGYPCLCFDVIPDGENKNNKREHFDCYLVAGTQAERVASNRILVMKLENLHVKAPKEDESNSDSVDVESSESENEQQDKPQLFASAIRHNGAVNRIKFSASNTRSLPLVAAWSDEGKVGVYDVSAALVALNSRDSNFVGGKSNKGKTRLPNDVQADNPQLFSFDGHETEGFALDWSPLIGGQLISGDCAGKIHLWLPREAGTWTVEPHRPFTDHESSVEDLQWSPTEKSVFCSCSADASIRVWDVRATSRKSQLANKNAHSSDVNVIAWNRVETSLLLSGGDDGALKVWDFRSFKQPVAHFKHHSGPITSVQWCPHDSSVFAASGEDDQVTLWDCSVEPDDESAESKDDKSNGDDESNSVKVPPQLLFIHQGQKEIKELRWYPHSEGVVLSVASTGLDIFRTISV